MVVACVTRAVVAVSSAAPMARRLALPLLLALAACRRTGAPSNAPTQPPEPDVVLPGDAPAPTGSCRLAGVTWVARPAAGERFTADDGVVGEADAGEVAPDDGTVTEAPDTGCGCRAVGGGGGRGGGAVAGLLAALGAVWARRRRRGQAG